MFVPTQLTIYSEFVGMPIGHPHHHLYIDVPIKATPHRTCAEDAPTDFSSDCIEIPQAY